MFSSGEGKCFWRIEGWSGRVEKDLFETFRKGIWLRTHSLTHTVHILIGGITEFSPDPCQHGIHDTHTLTYIVT